MEAKTLEVSPIAAVVAPVVPQAKPDAKAESRAKREAMAKLPVIGKCLEQDVPALIASIVRKAMEAGNSRKGFAAVSGVKTLGDLDGKGFKAVCSEVHSRLGLSANEPLPSHVLSGIRDAEKTIHHSHIETLKTLKAIDSKKRWGYADKYKTVGIIHTTRGLETTTAEIELQAASWFTRQAKRKVTELAQKLADSPTGEKSIVQIELDRAEKTLERKRKEERAVRERLGVKLASRKK